ncbi:hypothetical protein BH23CHL2_BH23CHL2_20410 [soil metagenome]
MTDTERYGRILLAVAVLGLFATVVVSMIAGSFMMPMFVVVVIFGAVGYVLMQRGKRA